MQKRLLYLLLLISFGCVQPYEVELEEGPQILTVDGTITSGAGPHRIFLSKSATYGSIFEGLVRPVSGATVIARDELGNMVFFSEKSENRGEYQAPDSFFAVIGRSYTLQIQLSDGKVYTSFPEKVTQPPAIKKLSYKSVTTPVEGEINNASGVQLIVDIDDPGEENNFYYWRNAQATYVLETRPDLFVNKETRDPAPKDCCSICYTSELVGNQSIFIATDDNFNGLSTKIPVAYIPDDGVRFIQTYRIDLRQLSISSEAYRFLRLVKQQSETSGSIFDPPPASIRGNMISLDDPNEVVLGYFIAAGETSRRVYIKGAELDFRQNRGIIPDDCREVYDSVVNPPADWNPEE
ncbi:DUF4249 domain-containing protein [Algoriphagus aquimarinus]|uniref:DUF4249 domain-containing protein n=1 Tax=Algoriphagus aquimarinus TaxID=237018 RepID=A0A5C7B0B6_9BACT|nr:DUF4249 domain-containing protein [Algoriphagus aquimarinus]TXE14201.1 DUF4249 domain-containing protein [Algoriphagus aquimarinus]